jgi:hypothetical protein
LGALRACLEAVSASSPSDVLAALLTYKTDTGGRFHLSNVDRTRVLKDPRTSRIVFEPENSTSTHQANISRAGKWEPEGVNWEREYATPLKREVEALLSDGDIRGWDVTVNEQGNVEVSKR